MSSESEEDFLSADEGSEDEEPISKPSSPALQGEHPVFPQERGATDGQDAEGMEDVNTDDDKILEPATESEMHKISETSNIKESLTLDEALPTQDVVENLSTEECQNLSKKCPAPSGKDHTATMHDDPQDNLLYKSKEETVSQLEERKRVDADSRNDSSPTEICRSVLQVLKVSDKCDLGHPMEVKEDSLSGKEDNNKKDHEAIIVKEKKTDPGSDKTRVVGARMESETVNLTDKTKDTMQEKNVSSTAEEDASSATISKKPRESKIGRKKPREKLGERLGAKKLGSRMVKKPLESISSDDVMTPKPGESDSVMRHGIGGQQNSQSGRCVKEESKLEAEKSQERECEEKRWQQAQQPHQHHVDEAEVSVGWGDAWGGWGSSLLSAASTFTREVGRGVGTVMETVESGLGVPDAETMAQEVAERTKKEKEQKEHTLPDADGKTSSSGEGDGESGERQTGDSGRGGMWLGTLVSGVSGALETASNKVLLGGLDTLEVLGRKAMDVIQDGDPGLRKKRAILTNVKPNLSQVLQDARLRAAEEEREGSMCEGREASHVTFAVVWDRTEGVVHLEALSLVARQCEAKITSLTHSLPHYLLDSLHSANAKIKSTCEMAEEESLEGDLAQHVVAIIAHTTLPLNTTKICDAWSRVQKVSSEDGVGETELYESLAEVVAQLVALIHKAAELALITPESEPDKLATQFKELSSGVWGSLEGTADQVCGNITTQAPATDSNVNNTITNIYLQVSHGSSYIQQSMAHLSSVLQYVNTKEVTAQL